MFDAIHRKRSLTEVGSAWRCHDERHRVRSQHDGAEVRQLLRVRELLAESLVEDGDQLEAEQRLDARQHHAAFLEQVRGGGVE